MISYFPQPNHHGCAMQQEWLTMPHGCLGSINCNTSSKCFILVSTTRQGTPQGHQHTGYCTAGVFEMKISFSIQIQTRFLNTIAIPKRQGAGVLARDPSTAESQIGWIISCFDWPTIWFFRLQPHMFLSPTEDCYATIPMSLRDILPIIRLLDKIRERKSQTICMTPTVYGSFARSHHFQKHNYSRKVQTFLPHNQLDIIDNNNHLGCVFIRQAFFLKLLDISQTTHSVLAIQVK